MFGKRAQTGGAAAPVPASLPSLQKAEPARAAAPPAPSARGAEQRPESYFQTKSMIFSALIEAIDLSALSKLDQESAREEIRDIVHEIVTIKNLVLSIAE